MSSPRPSSDVEALLAVLREQAARIAQLEQQLDRQQVEAQAQARAREHAERLLALLSLEEHMRLVERNIVREFPDLGPASVIAPDADDAARQAFAAEIIELAARTLERQGPDDPLVNLRAAERCAAIVRTLKEQKESHE